MHKKSDLWTIQKLRQKFNLINFPEYQREPNVWSKAAKQRLIDSIMREFDISSIYLYKDADGSLDCIDGRQRLGAIMAFLGENPEDKHEGFEYRQLNEIYEDEEEDVRFTDAEGKTFETIDQEAKDGHEPSEEFRDALIGYEFSVVMLSGSRRAEEFNLQFTRLNLGTIINSGEKLNAMVGDLRDVCFEDVGQHPFLQAIGIPTRRYAQEQLSAQILAQVFSVAENDDYTRTRHYDLQRLFKKHTSLSPKHEGYVSRVGTILDLFDEALDNPSILRNRALTVSAVLVAWKLEIDDAEGASNLVAFLEEFLCRLRWQLGKGLDFDPAFRPLIDFNRDVTQASVEKPSVERRTNFMIEYYERWLETNKIKGDDEYGGNPGEECREAL